MIPRQVTVMGGPYEGRVLEVPEGVMEIRLVEPVPQDVVVTRRVDPPSVTIDGDTVKVRSFPRWPRESDLLDCPVTAYPIIERCFVDADAGIFVVWEVAVHPSILGPGGVITQ
jgi:hypothetical protein